MTEGVPETLVERAAAIRFPITFGAEELDEVEQEAALAAVGRMLSVLHSEGLIYWAEEIETRAEESVRRILEIAHSEGRFYWDAETELAGYEDEVGYLLPLSALPHDAEGQRKFFETAHPVYRLRRDTP